LKHLKKKATFAHHLASQAKGLYWVLSPPCLLLIWISPAAVRAFSSTTDSLYVAERGAIVGPSSSATLTSMSCEACERMQLEETVKPHEGLQIAHGPTRLRPLGRRPCACNVTVAACATLTGCSNSIRCSRSTRIGFVYITPRAFSTLSQQLIRVNYGFQRSGVTDAE
jgi:hypothetical protein